MKYYYEYPRMISAIQLYYRLLYHNVGLHVTIRYLFKMVRIWCMEERYIQDKNPFVDSGNLANIIRLGNNGFFSLLEDDRGCRCALYGRKLTIAKWILHHQNWPIDERQLYFQQVFYVACVQGYKQIAKTCLPTFDNKIAIKQGLLNAARSNLPFFKWLYNTYKDHVNWDQSCELSWTAFRNNNRDIYDFLNKFKRN